MPPTVLIHDSTRSFKRPLMHLTASGRSTTAVIRLCHMACDMEATLSHLTDPLIQAADLATVHAVVGILTAFSTTFWIADRVRMGSTLTTTSGSYVAWKCSPFCSAAALRFSTGSILAINCAAVPETLLESKLFGHARGLCTGASQDRAGLYEAADGGTLTLEGIGDVPSALQVKLLRVL